MRTTLVILGACFLFAFQPQPLTVFLVLEIAGVAFAGLFGFFLDLEEWRAQWRPTNAKGKGLNWDERNS